MEAAAVLTAVTAVAGGVTAGVYIGFDTIVMPGLRQRPAAEAVRAMQAINRSAVRPGFMVWFIGSALVAVATILVLLVSGMSPTMTVVRVAGAALVAAGFVVTAAVNVPRNNAIDALDADAATTADRWRTLERGWVHGNRVRGLAALAGAALLTGSLAAA